MTYKVHREKGYPYTAMISIKLRTDNPDKCVKVLRQLLPSRSIIVYSEFAGKITMEVTYKSSHCEMGRINEEVEEIIHEFEQAADFR